MDRAEEDPGILSEPLTQRELNILAHLAQDRSSTEIAGLETIAASTVKWYIHQIYAKLGVNQRTAAISRAREQGLLPPEPGLRSNDAPEKHNLPRPLTSFIGRESEIITLLALVQRLPLVTLTGSGGTGKTRLALKVAERGLSTFADGVWLVNLAPLTDPDLVPLAAAAALGLREIPTHAPFPVLSQFIGSKHLLLVLDNCEHLVGAAATLAGSLLFACPHLHILATSREALGLHGEKAFRCPPLSIPDSQTHHTLAELAQSEAVRLFVERAQNVSPDFHWTETNALLIAQVCQRLDGIPLAIELAAARVHLLSMEQITVRLENVFHLLTGGGRAALPRHQTLKALVDWSYTLLSEPECRLLCRLSVFAGSWTLAAAEAVCAGPLDEDGGSLPTAQILDLLGLLVDKSLVNVRASQGAEPRYAMLEMIRQYAHQRLLERGGLAALREQHLDYYLALGLQAEAHLRRHGGRAWRDRLEAEMDNLRRALECSLSGSITKGLSLAAALQWFWAGSLHRKEGVDWLNRLLAAEATGTDRPIDEHNAIARKIARGKALNACSYIGGLLGQKGRDMAVEARDIFRSLGELCPTDLTYSYFLSEEKSLPECLELFRKIGASFFICEMLLFSTHAARKRGEFGQAWTYIEECLRLLREMGDQVGEVSALWEVGLLEFLAGNLAQAMTAFRASQSCCEVSGIEEFGFFLNRFFAWIALAQGDVAQAIQYSQAQWQGSSAHFIPWVMIDGLGFLGWEALTAGDTGLAVQYCEKALTLVERPDPSFLATAYYVLARVALARGELTRAGGFLKAFVSKNYLSWPPVQLGFQLYGMLAVRRMAELPAQALRAATLFGAQARIEDSLLRVIPESERESYRQALTAVRATLSEPDFSSAWATGQTMTTKQAIAYALAEDHG